VGKHYKSPRCLSWHGYALTDPQLKTAIVSMQANPATPWTVNGLAQTIGMSRSIFALKLKEKVGESPMEYLTRWRMLLAGDRLTASPEPILSIALSLGYESESAFGKAF
jgi:transcriptional regulator GlxA family with amidase domain